MDENEKETEQEKQVETADEIHSEPEVETSAGNLPENGEPGKHKNKRLINAIIRAGAALIAALLLLAVTKLSVFTLLKGPTKTDTAQHEEIGTFVKQDIGMILGDLSDQGLSKNYMVAGVVDKLVVIKFTDRYLKSTDTVKNDTLKFFDGSLTTLDKYVTVEGTVEKQSEELSGKLYDWYAANKSWMIEKRIIADTADDSTYLSDMVITVDTVNSMSETLVYVLTGIAALCLLYMIVELVLMAVGFYLEKPKKFAVANGAECIKDEEKSENNGSPEDASEEKTEEDE